MPTLYQRGQKWNILAKDHINLGADDHISEILNMWNIWGQTTHPYLATVLYVCNSVHHCHEYI